jgi:polysaccharide chain length determinant protein (PEP-CTERM system associated)
MFQRDNVAARFAESLFRHRWVFIIAVLVVSCVTMLAITLRSHTWQASALTQVKTQDVASELGEEQRTSYLTPAQENVNHFSDLLKDNLPGGFLDTALRNANLDVPINIDPKADDPRYRLLMKNLSVAPSSDTLFDVNLTWGNPRECEKIVAALQRQYIEEVGLDRSAQSIATARFLDTEIADYEARMRRAEKLLIDFKQQNAGHLPEEQSAAITQLSSLEAQRDNLMITQKDAALKMEALQQRLKGVSPYTILEQNVSQSPLMAQLMQLKAQRDTMLAKYKPNHPTVLAIDDQIKNLEKDVAEKAKSHAPEASSIVGTKRQDNPLYIDLQQQLVDARITAVTQQAQLAELNNQIGQYRGMVQRMPTQQRELNDRTRDYSILKERYETLLKKREEVEMQGALDKVSASSTLTPIGWIYAQPSITRPKLAAIAAGSVVLGLIVATLLLILNEWADRSLRYPGEVERLLGIPVLAALPESAELRRLGGSDRGKRRWIGSSTHGAPQIVAPAAAMAMSAEAEEKRSAATTTVTPTSAPALEPES